MRIYLTGGTGLVGSHVAEQLRARGDEVVCLQRPTSDTSFLDDIGCVVVEGNVRDEIDTLAEAMEGCDAVVHGAALVYAGSTWPRIRAVNVQGTEHVLRAAARAGLRRAVHLSSIAVYGTPEEGETVDEESPMDTPIPPGDLYARSKRESEAVARAVAEEERLDVTILRPAVVYGERDRMLAPRLAGLARSPVVPLLGSGENTLPVVYAGNVADAVITALDADRAGGVYNVAQDRPLTQQELVCGLMKALGRSPRVVRVPAPAVAAVARLCESLGLAVPGAGDLSVARVARLSLQDNPYRSERIRRELGWAPPFTHEEGLARTAAWLSEHHEDSGS